MQRISQNRIVVDYNGRYDLILLACIDTKTGVEMYYDDLKSKYSNLYTVVNRISSNEIKSIEDLKKLEENNKEGFVIRFFDGFRMKFKFDEYVRLHKIITNVSNLTIWEYLKTGTDFEEILNKVPDEFYDWVKKTKDELLCKYRNIELDSLKKFYEVYYVNGVSNKKEFAISIENFKYKSIVFNIFDKKDYSIIIWKLIRPSHHKPFSE